MSADDRLLLNKLAASRLLSISPNSFERHVERHLTKVWIGGSLRFARSEIEAYVAKLLPSAPPEPGPPQTEAEWAAAQAEFLKTYRPRKARVRS